MFGAPRTSNSCSMLQSVFWWPNGLVDSPLNKRNKLEAWTFESFNDILPRQPIGGISYVCLLQGICLNLWPLSRFGIQMIHHHHFVTSSRCCRSSRCLKDVSVKARMGGARFVVLEWKRQRCFFFFFCNAFGRMDIWAVLSDEQMSYGWPFSLLNDEQMSNKLGVEHQPDMNGSICGNISQYFQC